MFLRRVGLGQAQMIDTSEVYVPILVPRQEAAPAVTGANTLLVAAGLTAAGAGAGWLLQGPKLGRNGSKPKRRR